MGQRPVAVLLNDAYAGHLKWWDPDYRPAPAMAAVWTEWDYILLRVYQYLEDYTTANGHPIWVEEDPDVYWDMTVSESGYERAVHEYRETNDIKVYQSIRAVPEWDETAEPPSMTKWLKRLEEDAQGGFDRPTGGVPRPPSAEELAALRNPT